MEKVEIAHFKIVYNGKDISVDLSRYLTGVNYTDRVIGKTDEITIELEDTDGLWRNAWYPQKKDRVKLQMGYDDLMVDCGEFEVDEIQLSGPPDTVSIKGMASWVTSAMRTKDSYAHEGKTLKEIAQTVCDKLGLTLQGTIYTIRIARSTQDRETDLAYLKRISEEYGYVFSVRGTVMTFTSVYELEAGLPVRVFYREDLTSYDIRDKTSGTYKNAKVIYHNPKSGEAVEFDQPADTAIPIASEDTLVIKNKAENNEQAMQQAKAALHFANTKQKEGTLVVPGDPLLVAGNNLDLEDMGILSGRYHILESIHAETRSGGYVTTMQVKQVGYIEPTKISKPRKKRKSRYDALVFHPTTS